MNCQDIIKILIHTNNSQSPCTFLRELTLLKDIENEKKCNLNLNEFYKQYISIIGEDAIKRIENYDENFSDYKKTTHAHMHNYHFIFNQMINIRTWKTWFFS
jgi:hypothetical protein